MPDFSAMKLGKKKAMIDSKRLFLARYLKPEIAPAPVEVNWATGPNTNWGMLGNDNLGDCTIADICHGLQVWMNDVGFPWDASVSEAEAIKYYEWWCGYNPADPTTDQGGIIVDQLNTWIKTGFAGHKLVGYADPCTYNADGTTTLDPEHIRQSIALFGGVSIGISLPVSAQNQDVWDVVGDPTDPNSDSAPGSWGGHAIWAPAYNPALLHCITWGQLHPMTWNFLTTYCDEVHTLFGGMWVEKHEAPSGFDWTQLVADLQGIKT